MHILALLDHKWTREESDHPLWGYFAHPLV